MRYTVIYLDSFELKVIGELSSELVSACRKGRLSIVDMMTQREMTRNGRWVAMNP